MENTIEDSYNHKPHSDLSNEGDGSESDLQADKLSDFVEITGESIIADFSNLKMGKIFSYKKLHNNTQIKCIIQDFDLPDKELPSSDSGFFLISSNKESKKIFGFNKGDILIEKDQSYTYFDGNKMIYCNPNGEIIGTDKDYRE